MTVAVGAVYEFLIVTKLTREHNGRQNNLMCEASCVCGKSTRFRAYRWGQVKSCGCKKSELCRAANVKHGMWGTPTYKAWNDMWQRCTNPANYGYEWYADRAPPERWKEFENFLADMGIRPDGHSLERANNDLPYGPDNCSWLPKDRQQFNKANTRWVEWQGKRMCLADAVKLTGIQYRTALARLEVGCSVEEALCPKDRRKPTALMVSAAD